MELNFLNRVAVYHYQLPRSALCSKTTMPGMKESLQKHPQPFHTRPHDRTKTAINYK